MLQRPSGIQVSPDAPFAEDRLNRRPLVESLARLLGTITQPFVLSINGKWGTGKTVFAKMLKAELELLGHPCLYFNAWESDFAEDPFIALLGAIEAEMVNTSDEMSSEGSRAWAKAKRVGGAIFRRAIPVVLKIATHGIVDLEVAGLELDAADSAGDEIASAVADDVKERIEAHEAKKRTIDSFRQSLGEFARALAQRKGSKGPLVIFVDELDRCRPSFAVQLLERIKHLFNVDGVVFVLAIDREQLGHSVSGLYGAGMDAMGYLRRFIHLEYQLPKPEREGFADLLIEQLNIAPRLKEGPHPEDSTGLSQMLSLTSDWFGLALRAMEEAATSINVAIRMTPRGQHTYPDAVAFLVALRLAHQLLYEHFRDGVLSSADLISKLQQLPGAVAFFSSATGAIAKAYLHALTFANADYKTAVNNLTVISKSGARPAPESTVNELLLSSSAHKLRATRRAFFGRLDLTTQFAAE
jgi:hypothetical protein